MRHELVKCFEKLQNEAAKVSFREREVYAFWLAQAYYFVRHSAPLLALSCGRSVNRPEYHLRCISHLGEERAHDRLLLQDLAAIGAKLEDYPELATASALYQTQYYWIEHRNPVSFLGYISVLEALAVLCGEEKTEEAKAHGSTKFLELHAGEDVEHLERALDQVESLPRSDQEDILANARLTVDLYAEMLAEISHEVGLRSGLKRAKVSGAA